MRRGLTTLVVFGATTVEGVPSVDLPVVVVAGVVFAALDVSTSGRHLGGTDDELPPGDLRDDDTSSREVLFLVFCWFATLSEDLNLTALRELLERRRRSLVSLRSHIISDTGHTCHQFKT